ncbi:unnamed protein product, partial [Schistosoma spindalis]
EIMRKEKLYAAKWILDLTEKNYERAFKTRGTLEVDGYDKYLNMVTENSSWKKNNGKSLSERNSTLQQMEKEYKQSKCTYKRTFYVMK